MPGAGAPKGVSADEELIKLLGESFASMAPHADAIATRFYDNLFRLHPRLRSMFPADMTAQRAKIMDSLAMVVEGLRAPEAMKQRLQALGAKHRSFGTRPEHYPIVCTLLLEAMGALTPNWSSRLEHEWRRALELIASIMQSAPGPASATS